MLISAKTSTWSLAKIMVPNFDAVLFCYVDINCRLKINWKDDDFNGIMKTLTHFFIFFLIYQYIFQFIFQYFSIVLYCSISQNFSHKYSHGRPIFTCSKVTMETAEQCVICSKLTINTPELHDWLRFSVFNVDIEQTSNIILMLPLLNLNKWMEAV